MKVLLLNGSPHKKGCTYTALYEVAQELERLGIDSEIAQIGHQAIRSCNACMACAKREDNLCVFKDDTVNETALQLREADGFIVGAPVHFAGPAGAINAFLDRLFFLKSDHYANMPAAAVVSCRRGGASASFDRLNKYFTIARMPVVSSQYWNSVHGTTPDEVKQDLEGMQTMRSLAVSMAWMLRCIEAGKKAGIEPPVFEPIVRTGFIRT